MADLAGKYEVIIPVTTSEGSKAVGESVQLSGEDAKVFLARGFVKKQAPKKSSENEGK